LRFGSTGCTLFGRGRTFGAFFDAFRTGIFRAGRTPDPKHGRSRPEGAPFHIAFHSDRSSAASRTTCAAPRAARGPGLSCPVRSPRRRTRPAGSASRRPDGRPTGAICRSRASRRVTHALPVATLCRAPPTLPVAQGLLGGRLRLRRRVPTPTPPSGPDPDSAVGSRLRRLPGAGGCRGLRSGCLAASGGVRIA
jgi:hypothetical protein